MSLTPQIRWSRKLTAVGRVCGGCKPGCYYCASQRPSRSHVVWIPCSFFCTTNVLTLFHSKPKNAAKEVKAAPKGKAAAPTTNGAAKTAKAGKAKKVPNAGRPKKKTADELDAEMADYFVAPANGTAAPAAAAATNGAEPVDEVM